MSWFFWFFCIFGFLNAWIWYRLSRVLRGLLWQRGLQTALAVWQTAMVMGLILAVEAPSLFSQDHHWIPKLLSAAVFIWNLLAMPLTAITLLIVGFVSLVRKKPPKQPAPCEASPLLTRRQILAASAAAIPPVATLALAGVGVEQLGKFRVKEYHLSPYGWPTDLDGFTIAVVADIHTGVFTTRKMLDDIVETTNNLHADLTLLAGDLINISLADLPVALDMAMRLDGRFGVYMIQGNHDVIQNENLFNARSRARGMKLLLDEVATIRARGAAFQLLGTRWPHVHTTEMEDSVATIARARDLDLFPILLAHHPHTWDAARDHHLPLTISGHTHGGQIMLTDHIGGGPIRFKYWTGLYEQDGSQLIVSNGVGNWFPVRMNAPAEILRITLGSRKV